MAAKAKAKKGAAPKRRAPAKASAKAKAKAKGKAKPKAKVRAKAKPSNGRAAKPAVQRYRTLTPYLNVKGAQAAIDFYKAALGAKERMRMPGPDGAIMHCELEVGDSLVMLSEAIRDLPSRSSVFVYVDDCDAFYQRALEAGATVKMPMADMPWGDRFGSVIDPFGNVWSVATHKEDVPMEEVQRRMANITPPPAPPPATEPPV